jgi:hypothetical protein
MLKAYEPTNEEKVLLAKYAINKDCVEWSDVDKVRFIACINKKAGLPFGTLGLLRTESNKNFNGTWVKVPKEVIYADRQTTVELGRVNNIDVKLLERDIQLDKYALFVARATDLDTGRGVDATGVCALVKKNAPMDMEGQANKIMHAETKAKRRATLEACGLGFLDDSEIDSIEGAAKVQLSAPDAVSEGATTPKPSTGESLPSKGNGKASTSPATTTGTTPAPAPQAPAASAADSPSESVGNNAAPEPQAEAPKEQAAAEPAASSPSTDAVIPVAARYASNELMIGGPADGELVGADARYLKFIIDECTKTVGWDVPTMSQWLKDAYGLTNSNKKEVLTFGMFKLIMNTIDGVLTKAGR